MDILIRSALVQDGQPPVDIGIREGVIYKVAPRIDDLAAQVLDAAGRATIPGLIEPHIHLDKALLESRLANQSGTPIGTVSRSANRQISLFSTPTRWDPIL